MAREKHTVQYSNKNKNNKINVRNIYKNNLKWRARRKEEHKNDY